MDHLMLVVISGIASGAVYGLMGLGLVIIYRATDVVNFALASMATLAVYVALMVVEQGLGVVAGISAAVLVAPAREHHKLQDLVAVIAEELNVEDVENWYPMVYLYRRDLPDSGGAGRWRAGIGFSYAFMANDAQSMSLANFGAGATLSSYNAHGTLALLTSP
jgi:hypothetical protein